MNNKNNEVFLKIGALEITRVQFSFILGVAFIIGTLYGSYAFYKFG